MFAYMYAYKCTLIHTTCARTQKCTHKFAHSSTRTHMHTRTLTHKHPHTPHTHTHTNKRIHAHGATWKRTHSNKDTQTHIHTSTHLHTSTHHIQTKIEEDTDKNNQYTAHRYAPAHTQIKNIHVYPPIHTPTHTHTRTQFKYAYTQMYADRTERQIDR